MPARRVRRPETPPPPSSSPEKTTWAPTLVVVAVVLAASLAGIGNELVQDDFSLLVESERLHGLGGWRELLTNPYWPPPHSPDLYRPLTSLLLALQYEVGSGNALIFRLTSYGLYAAAAVAVYQLGRKVLPSQSGIALAIALGFAAHPVHVEAVALAVGQSELLVALFGTPMVLWYLVRRRSDGGELGWKDWVLMVALYLAAGLSKEQGLVLPGLLIAAELTLIKRAEPWSLRVRRLGAGYIVMAAAGVAMLLVRRSVLGELAGTFTASALQGLDHLGRALTMLTVVPHWARLFLWPVHLQADYSPTEIVASTGFGWSEALGLALILSALAVAWVARRSAPVVSFGLIWMAVALFPVSNVIIPTGIVLAERTLFLPSVGFVITVGGVLSILASKPLFTHALRLASAGVVLVIVATLAVRSADRHRDWRNDAVFRVRSAEDAPRSWRTQLSYASHLFDLGSRGPALERYQRALDLAPTSERWRVRNDLAEHHFAVEETAAAVEQLRASLAEDPGQESTRHYLVLGLLALGRYQEAGAEADSARVRGGSPAVFDELRVLADSASRLGVPPGGIKIRVRPAAGGGGR